MISGPVPLKRGSKSVVSEILHGSRKLNRNHIEKLSKRFNVSPAVFF
jgi:HTH-type transcriptional regulator/antitoxin HigA